MVTRTSGVSSILQRRTWKRCTKKAGENRVAGLYLIAVSVISGLFGTVLAEVERVSFSDVDVECFLMFLSTVWKR